MKTLSYKRIPVYILILTVFVSLCAPMGIRADELSMSEKGYKLQQVVVLSRHNIRAPLSGNGSVLDQVTPNTWFNWSSNASELSLRGGVLETEMGQFFRKWMESEGLIPENYHPEGNEVRVYSNSKQRTIATAKYFTAGFAPTANIDVEYHMDFNVMDPVFTPALNFTGEKYNEDATAQVFELYGDKMAGLSDNYELLTDIIDMDKSEAYKDYDFSDENTLILKTGEEPMVSGPLKLGTQISDALVLQYYEESDPVKAAFGNELSEKEWQDISEIKDVYGDVLFTSPMIAVNAANPLIKEIYSEMNTKNRLFTFLCGHDSNIGSVLAALGVKDYELEDSVESTTPIGCKLVFSKWVSKTGRSYWSVDLVYQSYDQLREQPLLDLENTPMVCHLSFKGIKQNKDGLYKNKAIKKIFENAMKEYDSLLEKYSGS